MAAMLAVPAVGVVRLQQDGWLASPRARVTSSRISGSGVTAISGRTVASAVVAGVDSERHGRAFFQIASSKHRWLKGGDGKIELKRLQRRVSVQQRHVNLPAPKRVVCGTCGNLRRKTSLNWVAPSPRNFHSYNGLRRVLSNRSLFLTQATTGPHEPHAANLAWLPEEGVIEDGKQSQALQDELGSEINEADFLVSKLPTHPKLHHGRLANGLQYVILPNKVPPNRCYHLSNASVDSSRETIALHFDNERLVY